MTGPARGRRQVAALFAGSWLAALPAGAADSPQWGEPFTRNMVSAETGLPAAFDPATGSNVAWTADLGGQTYGSPVIAGGRVWVGTSNHRPRDPRRTGDRGVLMCFRESDGAFLWQLAVPKRAGDRYLDWPGTGLCSPPTVVGDRLYVLSNRGELLCLDVQGMANGNDGPFREEAAFLAADGEEPVPAGPLDADIIWALDLKETPGIYTHDGIHAAPVADGDLLYLNTCNGVDNTHRRIRRPDAATLIAVDLRTGRLVAADGERIGPRIVHCQWSSPAMAEIGGRRRLVLGGADAVVYAFDALSSAGAGSGALEVFRCAGRLDLDPGTVKENACEWNGRREPGGPSTIHGMPVIAGSRLYITVGGDRWWGKRESWLVCAEMTGAEDGGVTLRERWRRPLVRHSMSTPAVKNGLVFVPDSSSRLHCFDADTGEAVWARELRGEVLGSPLAADGKVFVGTQLGVLTAFAATRAESVVGETAVGDPIWGTPAAANGRLFVASMKRLYALETRPR